MSLRRLVLACLAVASLAAVPSRGAAEPFFAEWGVSQRVPGGLAAVAEGQQVRAGLVTPLAGLDELQWAVEAGTSRVVSVAGGPSTAWLAVSAGLWRAFPVRSVRQRPSPTPFIGAHLDAGLARVSLGSLEADRAFVGGRIGGGVRVPATGWEFVLAAWLVANEAGPGLSLTVACRLPTSP